MRKNIVVDAQKVTRTFQNGEEETEVLKGLDLSVQEGEMVAIMGKSGSGKSTFLYQMGLLDHPTSGSIVIDGVDITTLSRQERSSFRLNKLGYVFQSYALLPSLTAQDNVMVPLMMQGIAQREAEKKAQETLARFELTDRANYYPSQLSGGQQQRVAIARAIAHDPKIIFADEPTANLDTDTSNVVLDLFVEINKSGQTIILVTHDEKYAKKAHRKLVMRDGVWEK